MNDNPQPPQPPTFKRLQKQLGFSAMRAKTSISADCTADSLLFSGNRTPASAKAVELKAKADANSHGFLIKNRW
jgi:hypothetical protein